TLTISITATDLATAHDVQIAVVNPGNQISPTVLFSIAVPVPTIDSVTPTSVISGEPGFQVKVTGSNFSSTSVINVNGSAKATSVQSSTGALTANISDADIAAPGSLSITVTDNGATSTPASIEVLRPTIDSVDPPSVLLGSLSATIRISGEAFLPTSKVIFRGSEVPTTFNTDGSLTAIINGADLIDAGSFAVNVRNSESSLSAPFFLTVVAPGTPVINSIAPSSLAVGATGDITINGLNFVPLSVVRINGVDHLTTFLGGTQITASLLTSDTLAPGSLSVTVRNPDGTTSPAATLAVTGAPIVKPKRRGVRH